MTARARREYAEVLRRRYQVADRQERGRILDEYCRNTGAHRKAAIRRLHGGPARPGRPAGRPRRYGPELLPVLERLWASDYLCGKMLAAILPRLLAAAEKHHGLRVSPAMRAALRTASPATLDRLLRPLRRRRGRQPQRVAPAISSLRMQVPLRTWSEWTGVRPGALQGDLVLHCGESTAGFYLATLVAIDVATTWTELQPIWGLHHRRVTSAVHLVRQRLPFALRAHVIRALPREAAGGPTRPCVGHSNAQAARRLPSVPVQVPASGPSAASLACPASLIAVIVLTAKAVSKETGSDLK